MPPQFESIAIVGVGLIGGSVALALRDRSPDVHLVGVSRDPVALPAGLVDTATSSLEEASSAARLILLCTPPRTITSLAERAAKAAQPGTIVSDVASTKARITETLGGRLPNGCHFVGGHPLAGGHASGAEAARADLFERSRLILTPGRDSDPAAVEAVSQFWRGLGAEVVRMSAEEHDRWLASASHLPHLVASALARVTSAEALPFTAGGWRDTTRVAAANPEMWADILLDNQQAVLPELRDFAECLAEFRQALETSDRPALVDYLKSGKERRDALGS